MRLVGWVAAYILDGLEVVYTSQETAWVDLPDDGFAAGKVFFDEIAPSSQLRLGTEMSGEDWYLVDVARDMYPFNSARLEDNLRRYPWGREWWKSGQWFPTEQYERLRRRIVRLDDLPEDLPALTAALRRPADA